MDSIVSRPPANTMELACGCLLYVQSAKHHGITLHCKDHRTKAEIENDEEGLFEKTLWQASEIERLRAENHGLRIRVFTLLKKLEEK